METMIPRKCAHPLCNQVFRVHFSDFLTKFHAAYCKEDYQLKTIKNYNFEKDPSYKKIQEEKEKKCLSMVNSEKMGGSGMVAGERPNSLKEESSKINSENAAQKSFKQEEIETRNTLQILRLEKETFKSKEIDTMPIKSEKIQEGPIGVRTIETDQMKDKELTTMKTNLPSSPESLKTDSSEIPSLESSQLSTVLEKEKVSSIETLNELSKPLLGYVKSAIQSRIDDNGDFIKTPSTIEMDTILRCAEAARNMQKTKLDYLKFSKDLLSDKNTKRS